MLSSHLKSRSFFRPTSSSALEQQANFIQQTDHIVREATNRLHNAVESKRNLIDVFYEELALLGDQRNQIAVERESKNADLFGIRRDLTTSFAGPCAITSLCRPYDTYNQRLLPVLQQHLSTMRHTPRVFQQTELRIPSESCMNRKTFMDIQIFTYENQAAFVLNSTLEECQRLHSIYSSEPFDTTISPTDFFLNLTSNKEALQQIKRVSIEDYKKIKLLLAMSYMKRKFEGRKSDWVLVTTRTEVNGKMYALSQYITWMNRDFQHDPVEQMTYNSIITLLHQDPFLIVDMLEDIAKLFKQVIEWDGIDRQELINHVALLQYEFAHAMPFKRGSAAISEWLEMIIYRYHGFSLNYTQSTKVNLEALTQPLKQFIEQYPSLIVLEEIKPLSSQLGAAI